MSSGTPLSSVPKAKPEAARPTSGASVLGGAMNVQVSAPAAPATPTGVRGTSGLTAALGIGTPAAPATDSAGLGAGKDSAGNDYDALLKSRSAGGGSTSNFLTGGSGLSFLGATSKILLGS